MILYLMHDSNTDTYSHPLVGPDLLTVQNSLKQLNPENLKTLNIIKLDTLQSIDDLKYLRVNKKQKRSSLLNFLSPTL